MITNEEAIMNWVFEETTVKDATTLLPGLPGLLRGFRIDIEGLENQTIATLAHRTHFPATLILSVLNLDLLRE